MLRLTACTRTPHLTGPLGHLLGITSVLCRQAVAALAFRGKQRAHGGGGKQNAATFRGPCTNGEGSVPPDTSTKQGGRQVSSAGGLRDRAPEGGTGRRQGGRGGGGRGRSGGPRHPADDDFPDLPSLSEGVEAQAQAWAAAGRIRVLRAAFNKAAKLGMRPGEAPRDDDPSRSALLRRVLGTLAAAYLPLVPRLRDPADCVLPLWACAKAGYWEGGLAAALTARLAQDGGEMLQRANGQDHGQLWWSLSEAPPQVLAALPDTAELLRASGRYLVAGSPSQLGLQPQNCSNVLLAAARLKHGSGPLLHHMTACLCDMLPGADTQHLANTIYALGELAEDCGHTPRRQDLQRLAGEVAARLHAALPGGAGAAGRAFIPQHLSNMLLGCAKLIYTDSALLRPLAAAAGQAAGRMKPQDFSHSLYALAVLGCAGGEFAQAIKSLTHGESGRLRQRPEDFKAQELSNTLWALAVLQTPGSEALVAAAAAEFQRRGFVSFKAQEVSNATWALAKLAYSDQAWYAAAAEVALQPSFMAIAKAQEQSNLLYALALVRHRPPAALLAGMADGQQLRTQANAQECVNNLWALSVLYGCLGQDEVSQAAVLPLVHVLAGRLGKLMLRPGEHATEQGLCNSLWAVAVMGPAVLSRHSGLVEGLLREVVQRWEQAGRGNAFSLENMTQLWQVHVELAHAGGDCAQLSGHLAGAGSLLGAARDAAEAGRREPDPATSRFQRQVLRALSRLQQAPQQPGSEPAILSVQEEHWVAELCCRVDMVVELAGGRQVAVEVDGPTHFLGNHPHTRVKDGPTQLRDRQLGRLFGQGNVVSVPYWEWRALRGGAEQEEYLRRMMRHSLGR